MYDTLQQGVCIYSADTITNCSANCSIFFQIISVQISHHGLLHIESDIVVDSLFGFTHFCVVK